MAARAHPSFALAKLFLVFALLLAWRQPASAQFIKTPDTPPMLEVAPTFHYVNRDSFGLGYGTLHYARIVSTTEIDPDERATGRVETMMLAVGFQSKRDGSPDFRWRAGVLNLDIIRSPLSVGITLADYDRTGMLDLDARWIDLRIGPSVYLGNTRNGFIMRATGNAGASSLTLGEAYYTGLSANVDDRIRTYEIGYLGEAKLHLFDRIELGGVFSYRSLLGDNSPPKFYDLKGSLIIRFSPQTRLHLNYYLQEARVGRSRLVFDGYGGHVELRF